MNTRIAACVCALSALLCACGTDIPVEVADVGPDILFDTARDIDSDVTAVDAAPDFVRADITLDSRHDFADIAIDSMPNDVGTDSVDSTGDDSGTAPAPWYTCDECETDEECAEGWACKVVRVDKYCVHGCIDNGDCDPGFTCESHDGEGYCIPVTQNCVACMGDSPCLPGRCCDFDTGHCLRCDGECAPCEHDFDCPTQQRCLRTDQADPGVCVPECPDGVCTNSDKFKCIEQDDGIRVCEPLVEKCGGCYGDTPFLVDGKCSECLTHQDCKTNYKCNLATRMCQYVYCESGLMLCPDDRQCHECCGLDSQCDYGPDVVGECLEDRTCTNDLPCLGLCPDYFPVCTLVQGVEQCVQCATDDDCAKLSPEYHCVGDPLYSCIDKHGCTWGTCCNSCAATCESSDDCPPTMRGAAQDCLMLSGSTYGHCVDPLGSCAGGSCCGPGMWCEDINQILRDLGGWVLAELIWASDRERSFCECDTTDDCINGKECVDASGVCGLPADPDGLQAIMCPGGVLDPSMPPKVCGTVEEILAGRPMTAE